MDIDPSCSQDQMEDKWASVMLSPFSRKHTPLKFDMHFDEREVLFLLHNMPVHTICLSQTPREKNRSDTMLPGGLDLVSPGGIYSELALLFLKG